MMNRWHAVLLLSAASLSVAVGCGSTVDFDDDGEGGSGTGGSGTGGSGASGGSGGTGATGTGATGAGGGGDVCDGFDDQGGGPAVTVSFTNNSGQTIYLPMGCSQVSYGIEPLEGEDGLLYVFETSCLQTCEDLQTTEPFSCGACAPTSLQLNPGETKQIEWAGTGLAWGQEMPDACYAAQGFEQTCSRILNAEAGTYRVDAFGYAGCEGCDCDDEGVCFGDATGPQAFPNKATFDYPSESEVEVLFDVCAFPCPAGD